MLKRTEAFFTRCGYGGSVVSDIPATFRDDIMCAQRSPRFDVAHHHYLVVCPFGTLSIIINFDVMLILVSCCCALDINVCHIRGYCYLVFCRRVNSFYFIVESSLVSFC